jgi:glutamine cyclotransferase
MIYVVVQSYGEGEDKTANIVYAGDDFGMAVKKANELTPMDGMIYLSFWEDGRMFSEHYKECFRGKVYRTWWHSGGRDLSELLKGR